MAAHQSISIASMNGGCCYVNGKMYFGGRNMRVVNNRVWIDGKDVTDGVGTVSNGILEVRIEGILTSVETDCSVTVTGSVNGNVQAGGSVSAGDIGGKVNAGGSVNCGQVTGSVNAGGSVNCRR